MLSSHFCTGINELWHEIWRLAPPSTNANAAERLAAAERLSAKRLAAAFQETVVRLMPMPFACCKSGSPCAKRGSIQPL